MERRFGADFGRVRLHTGPDAVRANRAIQARAFTYGSDIVLGAGRNDFASRAEQKLLAHELTHVLQQTGRTPLPGSTAAPPPEALRIARTPVSVQRYSWDEFKKDAGSIGSALVEGARDVASSVMSPIAPAAAAVADTLDWRTSWQRVRVDWNSEPGLVLKNWAARLDPAKVRDARAAGPAGAIGLIEVPDSVRQAAEDLSRNARMDVQQPPPTVDPGLRPGIRTPPPGPISVPFPHPILLAILIFLAILFWSNTTPEQVEPKHLEEDRKRELDDRKKKNEEERGRCRETIPALRGGIWAATIQGLDANAQTYLFQRLGDTPRTREALGDFFLRHDFLFFLAIVKQTKNAILKVCSVSNNTLGTSAGNKGIAIPVHAEELAAPGLTAQLQAVPIEERTRATLYNVCQSRACAENARNPEGCTAILETIRNTQLPGGEVVDEPTGFPPDLRAQTDHALEQALRTRLPNP